MQLLKTEYLTLFRAPSGSLVMRRSSVPYPTVPTLVSELGAVQRVISTDARFTGGLVLNSTAIQGRNDDAFEAALKPLFLRFLETTRRTAVVVLSTPGQLQTRRLATPAASNYQVFRDEAEALVFVDPRPGEPSWRRSP